MPSHDLSKLYPEITLERVNQLLDFNRRTGDLRWKVTRAATAKAGDLAGGMDRNGYVVITLFRYTIAAARLVWFITHDGEWPSEPLRCLDGDKENLRPTNWVLRSDWVDDSPAKASARARQQRYRQKRLNANPAYVAAQAARAADLEQTIALRAQREEVRAPLRSGRSLLLRHPRKV